MNFSKVDELLFRDEQFAKAYGESSLSFEVAKTVLQARVQRNITQKQLANVVGTGQSSIARLESGESLPSLSFLNKIAKALDMVLIPPFFIPNEEVKYLTSVDTQTHRVIVKLIELRKANVSNPRKALDLSTNSANFTSEFFGGSI